MEMVIVGGIALWFSLALRSTVKSGSCSGCSGCAYRGKCGKEKK